MRTPLRLHPLAAIFLLLGVAAGCGGAADDPTGAGGTAGTTGTADTGGASTGGASTGGASTGGSGAGGTGTGGSSTGGASTGGTGAGACDGYQGQATATEIAQSPFADEEAEMLAIEASGELVAPQHVYQRIVSDLALIRAQHPEVQGIGAMKGWVPDELLMGFDDAGLAAVQAGTYTDWDCANAYYGFVSKEVQSFYVLLKFAHRYNMPLLASEYDKFSQAQYAEPNGFLGDGNDLCVSIEKDTKYSYVFDAGSGDCPAGCIEHVYWGFTTEGTPVQVTPLGTFTNAQGAPPPWFNALADCTKWL